MYITWNWIKDKLNIKETDLKKIIEKLNYLGLECEDSINNEGDIFINFMPASNRKDLRSWWGIAREISVLLNIPLSNLYSEKQIGDNDSTRSEVNIEIKSRKVKEYNIAILENLSINNAPSWIQKSLAKNQIRSVNGLVDIINYVTIETGQPLHVFDGDKIPWKNSKKKITIKELKSKSSFIDLYNKQRNLEEDDIVISAGDEVISIAGIIGDKKTSVDKETNNIIIESANFDSNSIADTGKRINLKTKACEIFAKSYNQESPSGALLRATELMRTYLQKDKSAKEAYIFNKNHQIEKNLQVKINQTFLEKKLGIKINKSLIEEKLRQLNFEFKNQNNQYLINVPSNRKDLLTKIDIVEEIGKVLDYNTLPGSLPSFNNQFIDEVFNKKFRLKRKIENYLINAGYQEIISYSLIEDSKLKSDKFYIKMASPKSENYAAYRRSFIESHLKIIKQNLKRGIENIFLFETGDVYEKNGADIIKKEILTITGIGSIIHSPIHSINEKFDFYWLKGTLENIFTILGLKQGEIKYINKNSEQLKINQSAGIVFHKNQIGIIGEIDNKLSAKHGLESKEIFIAELSIKEILNYACQNNGNKFQKTSQLPIIKKDISFVIEKTVDLNEVEKLIKENGGEYLTQTSLFDIYEKNVEKGKCSVSYRLIFQGKEENLKNLEIEAVIKNILKEINEKFSIIERK